VAAKPGRSGPGSDPDIGTKDDKRLALVTGAQQGIGYAIARALACSGCDVVIADLHREKGAASLRERWGCSSAIFCLKVDVSDELSVQQLFNQITETQAHCPGAIETARTQVDTSDYADSWSPLTPMRRIGTVNDVANAVVALVSDKMSFVSAETINIDGGLFSSAAWPRNY